jgi:hypothetical protein
MLFPFYRFAQGPKDSFGGSLRDWILEGQVEIFPPESSGEESLKTLINSAEINQVNYL